MQLVAKEQPDLAIIDISLPDGDGIDLIKTLRAQDPNLKMLVFSMHDENTYALRTLRAGATGYVKKGESPDRIIEAVRKVLAGKLYVGSAVSDFLQQALASKGNRPLEGEPTELLTDRELAVLRLIGDGLNPARSPNGWGSALRRSRAIASISRPR